MDKTPILVLLAAFVAGTNAVVGGRDVNVAPHLVSIQVEEKHLCGGVIIHPKFILTVAHFFASEENLNKTSVFTGSVTLSGLGKRYFPEKFIIHEKYNREFPYHYDIGLIRLKEAIQYNAWTQPISLLKEKLEAGTELVFAGWGLANISAQYWPDRLQTVNLTIVRTDECLEKYGIAAGEGEYCSVSPAGTGPCNNDSGGGLTYNGGLYGIDSFGNSDRCDGEKPDITTSTLFHIDWINRNVGE